MRYFAGKTWIAAAAAVLALSCTTYCEDAAADAQEQLVQIGEKTEENDYQVEMKNSTGKDITSVSISVDAGEYGENLLADGTVWEADASGMLYCTPAELKEGAVSAPKYDIELVFADEKTAVLHTFPFGDADSVTVLLDELSGDDLDEGTEEDVIEIAYMRFVSKSLGTEQDTQWHEWDVVAPGKAEEAAAAYAAAQAAARAAAAASASSYSGGGGGSNYSYSAPANNGGNGGGNDEQCLTGGLLN